MNNPMQRGERVYPHAAHIDMDLLVSVKHGLVHLERFMETRHNYIPFMGWERSFAGAIGLSLDQTRFMLALIASIPAGYAVRGLRSSFGESEPA